MVQPIWPFGLWPSLQMTLLSSLMLGHLTSPAVSRAVSFHESLLSGLVSLCLSGCARSSQAFIKPSVSHRAEEATRTLTGPGLSCSRPPFASL